MATALAINVVLLVATVVGGLLAGSLALLADAGHLASDVGAIAIGLMAARLAGVAPTPARTYGLQRSEVLGALANGVLLLVVSVLIVVEALTRLGDPPDVGGAGDAGARSRRPGRQRGGDLGARRGGARGHQPRGRAAPLGRRRAQLALEWSSAGALVLVAGWNAADPIASLLIAALIAAGSWRLLKEPVDVLLESAPAGTDVRGGRGGDGGRATGRGGARPARVDGHVRLPGAVGARGGGPRRRSRRRALARMERMLAERFDIHHTTLQVVECADPEELIQLERRIRPSGGR